MSVLERIAVPVVQAPMAGGHATPALAHAVSAAGGLGFLAAGYRRAGEMEEDIAELRRRMDEPFGVNVFVPGGPTDRDVYAGYLRRLEPIADAYGVELGDPRFETDDWDAKLEVLGRAGVPVVSFTFGCPAPEVVEALRGVGTEAWVTVTDPAEARMAARSGADAVVAQGYEAGAHRAAFDDRAPSDPLGVLPLVQLLVAEGLSPVVAAGGIATAGAVAAVLAAGAAAAQIGTAFLRCPEAGTSRAHREALAADRPTRLTRAFTGRQARGIVNAFLLAHDADAPTAYPEIHHATAPLRAAARASGDADNLNLWAGQAHRLATERPAGRLLRDLASDASVALQTAAARFGHPASQHGEAAAPLPAGALTREQARAFAARWLPAWTGNEPERLSAFYTDDVFYRDPAVPDGVTGRQALLTHLRRLLARFPDWEWRQRDATPMQGGFLNHWEATIPVQGCPSALTCIGLCTVELRGGRISRNEVFFDPSPLLAALQR